MEKSAPIKDWYLLGFLGGVSASVGKSLTNYALGKMGVPTTLYGNIAGTMIMGKRPRLGGLIKSGQKSKIEWFIGHAADFILGGIFGMGLTHVISKSPPDHETMKGIIGGGATYRTDTQQPLLKRRKS